MKHCSKCKIEKPNGNFRVRARRRDSGNGSWTGLNSTCKNCESEAANLANKADPEKHALRQRKHRFKRVYKITLDDFHGMRQKQGGRCAACGVVAELCVDHCHITQRVRALLCRECNLAIGIMREDVKRIAGLIRYLNKQANIKD